MLEFAFSPEYGALDNNTDTFGLYTYQIGTDQSAQKIQKKINLIYQLKYGEGGSSRSLNARDAVQDSEQELNP